MKQRDKQPYRDNTLRRLGSGLYAANWAPAGGAWHGSTIVAGKWGHLWPSDRKLVPAESVYGCVVCHQTTTRFGGYFWILKEARSGDAYVVIVSCPEMHCVHSVAQELRCAVPDVPGLSYPKDKQA